MCRSISANEKLNIVALGGCASKVGRMTLKPFISLHRIDKKATFPIIDTMIFDDLDNCISSLEFILLAKKPTLLAADARCLIVLEYDGKKGLLQRLQTIQVHDCKV
jgi:hypothetical protein